MVFLESYNSKFKNVSSIQYSVINTHLLFVNIDILLIPGHFQLTPPFRDSSF